MDNVEFDISDIVEELRQYTKSAIEEIEQSAEEICQEARLTLRTTSPRRTKTERRHYATGWRFSKETGNLKFNIIIHNTSKPHLSHLIENGHLMPNGSRAKAYPHIAPVQEQVNKEFEKKVEKVLEKN